VAGTLIPVIDGMTHVPDHDQLKSLGAAAASSGAVALFHMVGVTPEAPTLDAAFSSRAPIARVDVTMDMLCQARRELSTTTADKLDLVVLGSPHFSLPEFRKLAALVRGRRRHPDVELLVTTSRAVAEISRASGVLKPIEEFGARLTVDTCILATPMLPETTRSLMTNSAKFAYYTPGLLGRDMVIGSLADCVDSAEAGRIIRDETLWTA
jgi:predicted aconitase